MDEKEKNIELEEDLKLIKFYQKSGNIDDITPFFQKYMPMIYGVCLKYLKKEEDSKDAVMDIYEKLTKKLLTHKIVIPKSWLYVLTKNHCYEILRSNNRKLSKENDAYFMYSEKVYRPINVEEKESELRMLEECIAGLDENQKKCVSLFYLEKKTYKEICSLLNITWSKARSLIQNGRRNLKKCLEKKYESIKAK